jgi:DNA polymerase-3 subunit beta
MHLTVLQENLLASLQNVQRSIPSRPTLPILACILLKADKKTQTLLLSATDLNIGVRSYLQCEVEEEGMVAVPAKLFTDYVLSLDVGKITLSFAENSLTLTSPSSRATIQCLTASDYPLFPESEGEEFALSSELFLSIVKNTTFATSPDDSRPILTAVIMKLSEVIEVAGTDGFRLSTSTFPLQENFSSSLPQILLPAKALNEVARIITRKQSEKISFKLSEKLKQVFFSFDGVDMLVRLMEGDFPPYQKIIPPDFSIQATFSGEEFAQKLKTAMIFAKESSGIVKLQVGKDSLKLLSASSAQGTQESTLPIKNLTGLEGEIAFNAKYLTDFFHNFGPSEVWFGMNESLKPALFRPIEMENYKYVVMPFRVTQ